MSKKEILDQIERLNDRDKIWLVEETLKSLKMDAAASMSMAADEMLGEYRRNKELTAFTYIDLDHFCEPMRS
jgi:hypothetical protein